MRSIGAIVLLAITRTPASLRPFLVGGAYTVAAIWFVALCYLVLAKPAYTSKWTLILPTAASSMSLQLESIGHAQTVASSPFGSVSLSPKVIYKEIVTSEQVRSAAAKSLGLKLSEFGTPRVKLIDETALMLMEIAGRSAEQAQAKANALLQAFHSQLDILRRDEIERRATVVQQSLATYQVNLQSARNRILDHQQRTGVLSINQFNESSTSLQLMQRRLTEVRAEISRLEAEQARLRTELGIDVDTAAALLRLSADPTFLRVAGEYADSRALLALEAVRLGSANPMLAVAHRRTEAARDQLRKLVKTAGLDRTTSIDGALLVLNGTHRSELVKALLANASAIAGRHQELATLQAETRRVSDEVASMSVATARLEDLKKDHIVAEAVFTSALARLDTNKVDIYASYPMVQTLAAPDLPEAKSSPHRLLVLLGAMAASLMALGAWGMAWLRSIFSRRR